MTIDAKPLCSSKSAERQPEWEMFNILPVGIILIDREYTIRFWNQCIARWTEIPGDSIVGQDLRNRFPHLASPVYTSRINQIFAGGPAVVFSFQFHPHIIPAPLPNGELLAEHTSVIPFDYKGDRLGIIMIEDITDLVGQVRQYRAMRQLANDEIAERKKAQDALFTANKKLNLLSSITRHDVLNQVTAVSSYLYLLENSLDAGSRQCQYVHKISRQMEMITHLLEIAREYEQMGISAPVWCDMQPILADCAQEVFAGSVKLVNNLPTGFEIFADKMIGKVMYNLFDNAKYHGMHVTRITVAFSRDGETGIFSVEDDGVGVPDSEKSRIFLKGVGSRSGLGLYLAQEILSLTGLKIRETGTPGKGARFEILIPPTMSRIREL